MTRITPLFRKSLVLTVMIALASQGVSRAEVSVQGEEGACRSALLMMMVIEDPDPVGSIAWTPYRRDPSSAIVNSSGEPRGDLFPDTAFDPEACVLRVVWPFSSGSDDYRAVFTEVLGGKSHPYRFLGDGAGVELDPRVFVAQDGTVYVTWWSDDDGQVRVFFRERIPGARGFEPQVMVSQPSDVARRPTVAVHDDKLVIAYETETVVSANIVVATFEADGTVTRDVVASSQSPGRLDPVLHVANGRFWLDWKSRESEFAYSEWILGVWSKPSTLRWTDPTWVGVESLRRDVQRTLMQP